MDKQFAENLKNARIRAGLTQAQVAEKIGVAPSSYSFYESGKREPDVLKIKQIAAVLGVTGDDLLGIELASTYIMERLTNEESEMLDKYRALPRGFKNIVDGLINGLYAEVVS